MPDTEAREYRTYAPKIAEETAESEFGLMDQATEQMRLFGRRVEEYAAYASNAVRHRPYTTIAISVGLAFALGALWKLQGSRQQRSGRRGLISGRRMADAAGWRELD